MMEQETIEPETIQPEEPDENIIDYNSFNFNYYIESERIVLKLESINENPKILYRNNFNLQELREIDKYFKMAENIEGIPELLKDIINERITIQKINENEIKLIIPYLKSKMEIPLKKYNNNNNEFYNSLSDEMKKIIDNDNIILGIDLGTTYSAASVMIDDKIIMIENSLGLRTTPSFVSFFGPYEICVGELAKLRPSNEGNIIYNSKRLLGKTLKDIQKDQKLLDSLNFKITEDKKLDKLKIAIDFKNYKNNENNENKENNEKNIIIENNIKDQEEYYPEQISSMILKKIVQDSEYFLSKKLGKEIKIKRAVITVPAYFNQKQREATIQAAEIINLKVERTINEPTAASLAYGYKTIENEQKLIVVIDFGGGTLDITLLKFIKNKSGIYCDIKYSYGDSNFGGEDFDYILIKKCLNVNDFKKNTPFNIRLKRACEAAKIKLSSNDETNIFLEEYMTDRNINFNLTRKDFESYCSDCFRKFKEKLNDFLENCDENRKNIKEVILIGGSTLIPKIKRIIKEVFSKSEIRTNLNPNEAVARGASILGGILLKLPNVSNLNLLDVTNLSLGVNVIENKMSTLIKRSTPFPYEHSLIYQTVKDNQTVALVEVFEGENKDTKENTFLGQFRIKNLPKKKAKEAKIKINFDINENSILTVTAYDLENQSNHEKLEIKKPNGLSDIIDDLKKENDKIKIIDIEDYNEVKDKILELEEKVYNSSDINEKDSIKAEIIKKFGEFIKKILIDIHKETLIFSYIKYYFIKVSKDYNNTQIEDKQNDFETVLDKILKEIQYYKPELICELIESFVDFKQIYSICLFQLINNYYEKFRQDFYKVEALLKKGTDDGKILALMDLSKLKDIIGIILKFYQRLDNEVKNFMKHIKDSIQDFELKIEVKEYLINYELKKINHNKKEELDKLKKLVEKYAKCGSAEIKDLKKLITINIKVNQQDKDIIDKNEKEQIFLYIFEKMPQDSSKKFFYFLEQYNPNEEEYNYTVVNNFIYEKREEQNESLVKLVTDFNKLYEKEKNGINGNLKKVYGSIIRYLNYLRNKKPKEPLFNDIK